MQEELGPGLENMNNFLQNKINIEKVFHVFKAWP